MNAGDNQAPAMLKALAHSIAHGRPVPGYCVRDLTTTMGNSLTHEEAVRELVIACAEAFGYSCACIILSTGDGGWLNARIVYSPEKPQLVHRLIAHVTGQSLTPLPLPPRREVGALLLRECLTEEVVTYPLDERDNPVVRVFTDLEPLYLADPYRLQQSAVSHSGEALSLLPLLAGQRSLGVLALAGRGKHLREDAASPALSLFAAYCGLAIEIIGLRDNLRDSEEQVGVLLKATIEAQEAERERICLDIHDGVAQTLAPAFQYLETLDSHPDLSANARTLVHKTGTLVRNAIREAREVIATLRPAALDTVGMVATLSAEVDELRTQFGWQVEFDADPVRFSKTVETALYRIVKEALTNVRKHAQAHRVVVRVKQEPARVVAEVQDDGVGFDPTGVVCGLQGKGFGLLGMRKRTEWLQGTFRVQSARGWGTRIRVEVPDYRSGSDRGE